MLMSLSTLVGREMEPDRCSDACFHLNPLEPEGAENASLQVTGLVPVR